MTFLFRISPFLLEIEQTELKEFVQQTWGKFVPAGRNRRPPGGPPERQQRFHALRRNLRPNLSDAVWRSSHSDIPGEDKNAVWVMYYATGLHNANRLYLEGFQPTSGFDAEFHDRFDLGQGIYVCQTAEQAQNFGPIIFRVLARPGKMQLGREKEWQSKYESAWTESVSTVLGFNEYSDLQLSGYQIL